MSSNNSCDRIDRRDVLAYRVAEGMGADRQHVCAATSFEAFPDSALEGSIVDRFAEQVARHHDCVAVVDGHLKVTYRELDRRANGVAASIVERAGSGRDPVALVVRQGAAYATAVLGTLKSGRPYVPLDPADPAPRLQQLIAGCGAVVVVTEAESRSAAEEAAGSARLVATEEVDELNAGPALQIGPDSLAYIFFTSGSTGVPKGVYDNHRNVLHNILRYTNALQISPADRLTLLQGPAFSGCVSSQFGALLNGAASFPFRLSDEGLVRAAEWLRRDGITIYHSVPSVFRAVVRQGGDFSDVRIVRLEGDRASAEDVELWRRHFARDSLLANGLGTTETGLARQLILSGSDCATDGALPVGYPIRDMDVEVVDEHRASVANGAVGEIAVSSPYLALGYWNQPGLTEQRFQIRDGARRYLTGDLGRLADDGCLEYLGRRDGDLKVFGTRVEPAEIEQELLRVHGIREAAVAVRTTSRGEGQLIAYVVAGNAELPTLHALRASLAERLPSAMLPTALIEVDELPLGVNGKVDRRALPEPSRIDSGARAAEDDLEAQLARIWEDALDVRPVGMDDDFSSLGGDSLAAADICARVETQLGMSVPLSLFAGSPTIGGLATMLRTCRLDDSSSLAVLRAASLGNPVIFVHGYEGNALVYTELVRRLGGDRPMWALEHRSGQSQHVAALAQRHVDTLVTAQGGGSFLLVGSCYGAALAHAIGCRLRELGHDVAFLALLAFTPIDFPTLIADDAREQWSRSRPAARRFVYYLKRARSLPPRKRFRFLARRSEHVAIRGASRVVHILGGSDPREQSAKQALGEHRPRAFPGRALLVLHEGSMQQYTSDPESDWSCLTTDGVDVEVIPGDNQDMLHEPGVARLAELLDGKLHDLP